MFKGVLIDFYWTLAYVDQGQTISHLKEAASLLAEYGYDRNTDELSAAWKKISKRGKTGDLKNMSEFYQLSLMELDIPCLQELLEDFVKLRNKYLDSGCRLYEDVIAVLSTLKKKYRLALVSNCSVGLYEVIEALGLVPFFDSIILSYQAGLLKPEKQIYLKAIEMLGLEPEECIFVSDEISDLEGARKIGLKTLLVRQGQYTYLNAKDLNFKPDFKCRKISEITNYI